MTNTPLNADDELKLEITRHLWMVFAGADWERTPRQWQHNGSLDVNEATEEILSIIQAANPANAEGIMAQSPYFAACKDFEANLITALHGKED